MSQHLGAWSRCAAVAACFPEAVAELRQATVIVTGPTSGIGRQTATVLAGFGAQVVLAARNGNKAKALVQEIQQEHTAASVCWVPLDLTSLQSVAEFAKRFSRESDERSWPALKILVCNAGIMNLSGRFSATVDGFEESFGVNHLGHFLLAHLLLPRLRAGAPARVVVVASNNHFGPHATKDVENANALRALALPDEETRQRFGTLSGLKAYANSKLASVCFARSVHARWAAEGVTACSLHPGTALPTDIVRGWPLGKIVQGHLLSWITKDVDQGSSTTMLCCLAPHPGLQGRYYQDCHPRDMCPLVTEKACDVLWDLSLELCKPHLVEM